LVSIDRLTKPGIPSTNPASTVQVCSREELRYTCYRALPYVDLASLSNQWQNVTSSSTVVAALEAARDKNAPIILQASQGGAAYFAGKVCRPA
jgi:hypothetical protein